MKFEIVGEITDVEVIARGPGVRVLAYLCKAYGRARWWKAKGEAHGIGRRDVKIKRYLGKS